VLRELHAASRPGVSLAELHDRCRDLYAEVGLPDEWRRHHQGGLTGYRTRETIATPATTTVLQPGHALAWNPSAPGVKAEETFVVREQGTTSVTLHVG
jgi:Xaa-Pro aminopeptidase